ncbi:QWRF motif-containing protein 2-like [Pyrus ussuriensis x Pyrus communis]|uniref:QWRF motif-containing protein 2-like n=1 Tax=Pyrus ussuriensis x Pyrus communis TaxID=2448454 RepID=A0A5N5H773_9ROSA|nr:QWRF motif-containing protein 2-like [Pyrus ussuriensis x Pyrus communis]
MVHAVLKTLNPKAAPPSSSSPTEQHLWPVRLWQPNSMSKSLDCTDERKMVSGYGECG